MKIIHAIIRVDVVCDDDDATPEQQLAMVEEGIGFKAVNYFRNGVEYTVPSVGLLPDQPEKI